MSGIVDPFTVLARRTWRYTPHEHPSPSLQRYPTKTSSHVQARNQRRARPPSQPSPSHHQWELMLHPLCRCPDPIKITGGRTDMHSDIGPVIEVRAESDELLMKGETVA